jgi:transcriptional regulator with XRE-family HTH domain
VKKEVRRRLEADGWTVGDAQEFLGLSDEEVTLIRIHEELSFALRALRLACHLTQQELAKRLGSSQSRIAKLEAGDATVSLDLLIRAHLALGQTPALLGRRIAAIAPAHDSVRVGRRLSRDRDGVVSVSPLSKGARIIAALRSKRTIGPRTDVILAGTRGRSRGSG